LTEANGRELVGEVYEDARKCVCQPRLLVPETTEVLFLFLADMVLDRFKTHAAQLTKLGRSVGLEAFNMCKRASVCFPQGHHEQPFQPQRRVPAFSLSLEAGHARTVKSGTQRGGPKHAHATGKRRWGLPKPSRKNEERRLAFIIRPTLAFTTAALPCLWRQLPTVLR